MNLTAANVDAVIRDCLFTDAEVPEQQAKNLPADAVIVDGIMRKFAFHRGRLESHRADVAEMLAELPDSFKQSGGGGMTFLNACMTKHDEQWGEHPSMESLFCLGIGLGLARFCFPRNMWSALPGGMPYVILLDTQEKQPA